MDKNAPVLLSYYALSNGMETLVFGQLTVSSLIDLSFIAFNKRKTFRTLLSLYRSRLFANEDITLEYNNGVICTATTDTSGAFFFQTPQLTDDSQLTGIKISSEKKVDLNADLYSLQVHSVKGNTILISDIDDTLLHSYVSKRLRKFRTLMFTSLEKRKAVVEMRSVIQNFHQDGVEPFYLSNSEQNLYPLIYRFLINNEFPKGPLFLRKMRLLRNVFKRKDIRQQDVHKLATLEKLFAFLPDRTFILVGDNTQNDLVIYLQIAEQFPLRVARIIIRQANALNRDPRFEAALEKIKTLGVPFHYGQSFTDGFAGN